jgi:hypothetical protein
MLRSIAAAGGIGNGGAFMLILPWLESKPPQITGRQEPHFREFDMVTSALISS